MISVYVIILLIQSTLLLSEDCIPSHTILSSENRVNEYGSRLDLSFLVISPVVECLHAISSWPSCDLYKAQSLGISGMGIRCLRLLEILWENHSTKRVTVFEDKGRWVL